MIASSAIYFRKGRAVLGRADKKRFDDVRTKEAHKKEERVSVLKLKEQLKQAQCFRKRVSVVKDVQSIHKPTPVKKPFDHKKKLTIIACQRYR